MNYLEDMYKDYHSTYRGDQRRRWSLPKLWELAEGLPVKEMDPQDLPEFEFLMQCPANEIWFSRAEAMRGEPFRMCDVMEHTRRVMEADLNFPILLNPLGGVMDGCHRIMKARMLGLKILVQQFDEWPPTE